MLFLALPDVSPTSIPGIVHLLIVGICILGAMVAMCVFAILDQPTPEVFPAAILIGIGYLVGANAINAAKVETKNNRLEE